MKSRLIVLIIGALVVSACGERRSTQGIRVGGGGTTLPVPTSSEERTAIGGKSAEVNEALYLRETISTETLRAQFAVGISAEQKSQLIDFSRKELSRLTVVKAADQTYQVRWRVEGKSQSVNLTPTNGVHKGQQGSREFQLACLLTEQQSVQFSKTTTTLSNSASETVPQYCSVARLDVKDGDLNIPYLVLTRPSKVSVVQATVPKNAQTGADFIKLRDGRDRHQLIALSEAQDVVWVTNTVDVLLPESRFGIEMTHQNLSLKASGDFTKPNTKVEPAKRSSVEALIEPASGQAFIESILTDNRQNAMQIGFFYFVRDPAAPAASDNEPVGTIELKFEF